MWKVLDRLVRAGICVMGCHANEAVVVRVVQGNNPVEQITSRHDRERFPSVPLMMGSELLVAAPHRYIPPVVFVVEADLAVPGVDNLEMLPTPPVGQVRHAFLRAAVHPVVISHLQEPVVDCTVQAHDGPRLQVWLDMHDAESLPCPAARVKASRGMATLAHVATTHLDEAVDRRVPEHHLSVNSRPDFEGLHAPALGKLIRILVRARSINLDEAIMSSVVQCNLSTVLLDDGEALVGPFFGQVTTFSVTAGFQMVLSHGNEFSVVGVVESHC